MRCRCCLWWPSLAPLPEGISSETRVAMEKVRDRLSFASLHICTACDSALSAPFSCVLHFRKFHLCLSDCLGDPNNFLFHFPFALSSPAPFLGGAPFQKYFFCVCFTLTSLHSSEDILHSPHAGYYLLPLHSPAPPPSLFCAGLLGLLLVCFKNVLK